MSVTVARRMLLVGAAGAGVLGDLVLEAAPAYAHDASGTSLPAPSWLLGYLGAFAVIITAVALRSSWSRSRWTTSEVGQTGPLPATSTPEERSVVGRAVGLALLVGALTAAIMGTDSGASNVAPVAVLVVWWVGLPLLCLVVGDVMRSINPFDPIVGAVARVLPSRRGAQTDRAGPSWTGAAFLAAFSWFLLCYHRPGSPRALAVFLSIYVAAAVLGGLRWGRGWLRDGEGFASLSTAVSRISWVRGRDGPPGLLAVVIVWLGGTCFDALSSTPFWIDVQGTSTGWGRTLLNTVGLVWMIAIVAAVVLAVVGISQAAPPGDRGTALSRVVGVGLVPLALGWFVAHDLTFLLFEGQNFYALISDPLGRGWDLFGTIDRTIDYRLVQGTWVRWVQYGALLAGHIGAVVVSHDGALAAVGRRSALRVTWSVAATAAVSIVISVQAVMG